MAEPAEASPGGSPALSWTRAEAFDRLSRCGEAWWLSLPKLSRWPSGIVFDARRGLRQAQAPRRSLVAEPAEASPGGSPALSLTRAEAFDRLRHRRSLVAEPAEASPGGSPALSLTRAEAFDRLRRRGEAWWLSLPKPLPAALRHCL